MAGRRVVVLGSGITGRSVAEYLYAHGDYVFGVDRSREALLSCCFFHEHLSESAEFPEHIDLFVRSPGVVLSHPWIQEARSRAIPIVTDVQLALQDPMFRHDPSIGITGSNGKTTTTLFLAHLLRLAGIEAHPMGNIGIPILQAIRHPGVRIVEISSFQLAGYDHPMPVFSAAAILNLSQNHLDYHETMAAYREAKYTIAKCLGRDALWSGENVTIGNQYIEYSREIHSALDKESALKPLYLHDKNNYCAAYVLANEVASIDERMLLRAVQTFKKPPHRIEYLGEKKGVRYINDSKATTMSSVEKALIAAKENVIIILGGRNKGGDFTSLLPTLMRTAKYIVAMGECREEIAHALSNRLPLIQVENLQQAVAIAQSVAEPGDTILLSPGCASFDQFRSFAERGEMFRQLIGDVEVCVR